MGSKKKKQHYVPQCYLESWAIPNTHQIYVYDKTTKHIRKNNITDVAEENYFYDIDFTGILTRETLEEYGIVDCEPTDADKDQYIENYFANIIEDDYKRMLQKIINRVSSMNRWEINNCYFISELDKFNFSFHLVLQRVRVKEVRNSIADSNDCLIQSLQDMGVPQEEIDKHTLPKTQLPYIHGRMILDSEMIEETAKSFFCLSWILVVNRTDQPFYTSDSPIGTQAHIQDPIVSMAGLNCRGVEAYFPLSPNLMLLMFDGEYHSFASKRERCIIEIDDTEVIKYCNSRCLLFSERCVFSNTDDFSVAQEMLNKNPEIFEQPHTVMHWGGKTYTPRRNKNK